jgi:hypothetical protein
MGAACPTLTSWQRFSFRVPKIFKLIQTLEKLQQRDAIKNFLCTKDCLHLKAAVNTHRYLRAINIQYKFDWNWINSIEVRVISPCDSLLYTSYRFEWNSLVSWMQIWSKECFSCHTAPKISLQISRLIEQSGLRKEFHFRSASLTLMK